MRKTLPIATALLPLLVAAAYFKFDPTGPMLGPVVIGSFFIGWIGSGFMVIRRLWLKILLILIYPLVSWLAITAIMVLVYGVPGGPF